MVILINKRNVCYHFFPLITVHYKQFVGFDSHRWMAGGWTDIVLHHRLLHLRLEVALLLSRSLPRHAGERIFLFFRLLFFIAILEVALCPKRTTIGQHRKPLL